MPYHASVEHEEPREHRMIRANLESRELVCSSRHADKVIRLVTVIGGEIRD